MNIHSYNRRAWNKLVDDGNPWTVPVSAEVIERAKRGDWQIVLTPTKAVPADWFPELTGLPTLCLASGGGQQGPVLAAAGAEVTVFDAAPKQLQRDREVARREGLLIETVEGDMADLGTLADETFGLIVHPCSNCFAEDIRPVWRECHRVLRPGGILIAGFVNPVRYIFDNQAMESGRLEVRHAIPYADVTSLDEEELQRELIDKGEPLEFGHSLDDQIGGQLDAGFTLTGFYEDRYEAEPDPLSKYLPTFIATRCRKGD